MRFKEIEAAIKADGWYFTKQTGSHHHYRHPTKNGKVTIPEHGGKDLDKRVIASILRQAGLK